MPLPGIVPAEFVAPVKGYAVPPERYSLRHRNEDFADVPRWVSDRNIYMSINMVPLANHFMTLKIIDTCYG